MMRAKKQLPIFILGICFIELLIYLWATWTATLDRSNFFAIESQFIFDKCARNSGRVSALLTLLTLIMVGYYGLKTIYGDEKKRESFRILVTLFSVNHLIHFMFLFLRFKSHSEPLTIEANFHGFITFIFIVMVPMIVWTQNNLSKWLYLGIILHLYNISYFINKTFISKVKPEDPAYHNQLGIVLISFGCLYVLYSVYRESRQGVRLHE